MVKNLESPIKRALITGGAVRVGREITLALAQAGWAVAIHCNRSAKEAQELAGLIHKKGGRACVVQANLSNERELRSLFTTADKKLGGPITCLINNAAVFEKDSLATLTRTSWQQHQDINLYAPLLLMQQFVAQGHYRKRSGEARSDGIHTGNIINILDGTFGWSMSPNFLSYTLSKMGLWSATELLAKELAPRIRVNGIAPGPTLPGKQDEHKTFEKLRKLAPLGRTSTPQEVCDAILYLLNAPAVTGQIIQLGGGLHLR